MSDRYVMASELKSLAFCRRAWLLERHGGQSALVSERARGRADHESHSRTVQQANIGRRAAALLFVLRLAGIGAAALLLWLSDDVAHPCRQHCGSCPRDGATRKKA
jgi:hypothetical protein